MYASVDSKNTASKNRLNPNPLVRRSQLIDNSSRHIQASMPLTCVLHTNSLLFINILIAAHAKAVQMHPQPRRRRDQCESALILEKTLSGIFNDGGNR